MKRVISHALATLILVAATLVIWHWRFAAVPDALPPIHLADPLIGWSSATHHQHAVVMDHDTPLLRLEKKKAGDKTAAIGIWLGKLKYVRFIRIRCESRWKDVELGAHPWNIARFVVNMKTPSGTIRHPEDSVIFAGTGSADWQTDEVILELTGDMADVGLQIAMLGKTGLLEVRNLSVVAVRQRPWVPAATVATVIGWLLLCASFLRWRDQKPAWWRAFAAAVMVVGASWLLIFPQTKGLLRSPLGGFAIGHVPTPPPSPPTPPRPPSKVPVQKPPAKPNPPELAVKPPAKPAPPAAAPKPVPRNTGTTHKLIRASDKRFPFVHLAAYAGFTFLILLITGQRHQWPLPLAVAILSELVPALHDHIGDYDDWTDLLQNTIGVALTVALWPAWRRLVTKMRNQRAGGRNETP